MYTAHRVLAVWGCAPHQRYTVQGADRRVHTRACLQCYVAAFKHVHAQQQQTAVAASDSARPVLVVLAVKSPAHAC